MSGLDIVKDCLELMLSLEFFQRYKAKTFELLEIGSGSNVLEVGCGTGVDARQLAYMVGEKGSVVAIDKSEAMIAEVRRQPGLPKALLPKVADVCRLPFEEGTFHAVRVDRTLQHVKDLERAIGEMVRVLASGGRVVASEPDWGTLQVDSDDIDTTRTMARALCDSIRHGWVGRSIYRHFAAAGLTDIEVFPETLKMTDLNTANEILHIGRTLRDCVLKGLLDEDTARKWFENLRDRDDNGQFFSSLTLYLVRGRKPLHRPHAFEKYLQNLVGSADE
jgi:ubiquinone/menaquinone biosynthesis C-methylase UbiE